MGKQRGSRHEAIKDIVRTKSVRTQRDLVDELRSYGFVCTQATISRDIADMGLRKLPEGSYVLAEDLHLQRMVSEFVIGVESIGNQVVVKTQPGTAPGVATALDGANLDDVVGSIAGNDTVLAIGRSDKSAVATVRLIDKLLSTKQE